MRHKQDSPRPGCQTFFILGTSSPHSLWRDTVCLHQLDISPHYMATTINQISPRCLAPWELHISACAAQGGDLLSVCRQQLVSGAICLASCDDAELSVMPPCRGSVCRGPAPLSSCTLQCKQGHVTQTFYTHTHFCVVTVDRDPSLSFNDRVSVICFQKYTLEDTRDSFGGQGQGQGQPWFHAFGLSMFSVTVVCLCCPWRRPLRCLLRL